jgi:hypothetical protein
MSYETWHIYGYGVKISEIAEISMSNVVEMVQTAPNFAKNFNEWLRDCDIKEPTLEDLEEFDTDYCLGLVSVLREVISEVENIELTACEDYDGDKYLLYSRSYPWRMTELEKSLKEEDIQSLMVKYLSKITDEAIDIDYYSPENGG